MELVAEVVSSAKKLRTSLTAFPSLNDYLNYELSAAHKSNTLQIFVLRDSKKTHEGRPSNHQYALPPPLGIKRKPAIGHHTLTATFAAICRDSYTLKLISYFLSSLCLGCFFSY